MCVSQQSELRWILVGLWVLVACAGRSTRIKGSQQTIGLSHPVRVAREQGKQGDFSRFRAGREQLFWKFAGFRENWRGRPSDPDPRRPLGPWNLPAWAPLGGTKAERSMAGPSKKSGGFTVLTGRSAGGLGRSLHRSAALWAV